MESDPNVKFNMKHGMRTTGTNSPYELIIGAKDFSVKDILKDIKIPTLVLDAEKEDSFPGQPKKVYDGLVSLPPESKKYILFTEEEGAEEHCQVVLIRSHIKEYLTGLMKYLRSVLNFCYHNIFT